MPRCSNIEETQIEFNKRNSQAGTRYRESGLVRRHKPDVKAGKELVQLATEIWHDLPEDKSTNSRRHRRYWAGSWEPARSRFPSGLDDVENFFHSAVALAFSPLIPVPAPPALLLVLTGILDLIGSNIGKKCGMKMFRSICFFTSVF